MERGLYATEDERTASRRRALERVRRGHVAHRPHGSARLPSAAPLPAPYDRALNLHASGVAHGSALNLDASGVAHGSALDVDASLIHPSSFGELAPAPSSRDLHAFTAMRGARRPRSVPAMAAGHQPGPGELPEPWPDLVHSVAGEHDERDSERFEPHIRRQCDRPSRGALQVREADERAAPTASGSVGGRATPAASGRNLPPNWYVW